MGSYLAACAMGACSLRGAAAATATATALHGAGPLPAAGDPAPGAVAAALVAALVAVVPSLAGLGRQFAQDQIWSGRRPEPPSLDPFGVATPMAHGKRPASPPSAPADLEGRRAQVHLEGLFLACELRLQASAPKARAYQRLGMGVQVALESWEGVMLEAVAEPNKLKALSELTDAERMARLSPGRATCYVLLGELFEGRQLGDVRDLSPANAASFGRYMLAVAFLVAQRLDASHVRAFEHFRLERRDYVRLGQALEWGRQRLAHLTPASLAKAQTLPYQGSLLGQVAATTGHGTFPA